MRPSHNSVKAWFHVKIKFVMNIRPEPPPLVDRPK